MKQEIYCDGVLIETVEVPEAQEVKSRRVKADAGKRIEAICPVWKQMNMIARRLELLIKGNPSKEEESEIAYMEGIWERIKAIRATSNEIEAGSKDIWPE